MDLFDSKPDLPPDSTVFQQTWEILWRLKYSECDCFTVQDDSDRHYYETPDLPGYGNSLFYCSGTKHIDLSADSR